MYKWDLGSGFLFWVFWFIGSGLFTGKKQIGGWIPCKVIRRALPIQCVTADRMQGNTKGKAAPLPEVIKIIITVQIKDIKRTRLNGCEASKHKAFRGIKKEGSKWE